MIGNDAEVSATVGSVPGASSAVLGPEASVDSPRGAGDDEERQTVLLVEDEESLRLVYRLVLERLGLRLLEAENGLAAQRLLEDHGGRLDLLVTDVVMPGVGGRQLAQWVRARWPGAGILYLSGLDHVPGAEGEPSDPLLTKPFYTQELVAKISELLQDRDSHRTGEPTGVPEAT